MRTIKFRGKRLDTGDWVYGDLTTQFLSPRFSGDTCIFDGSWHCIDPATIGQYTGLKDRNGVEIYEGDIVLYKTGYAGNPRLPISKLVGEIKWDDKYACFSILDDSDVYGTIIIGNIHDNPELLKGGEQ